MTSTSSPLTRMNSLSDKSLVTGTRWYFQTESKILKIIKSKESNTLVQMLYTEQICAVKKGHTKKEKGLFLCFWTDR